MFRNELRICEHIPEFHINFVQIYKVNTTEQEIHTAKDVKKRVGNFINKLVDISVIRWELIKLVFVPNGLTLCHILRDL